MLVKFSIMSCFELFEPFLWFSSILAIILGYYSVSNFNHWKKRLIPYVKPVPFFGNFFKIFLKRENFSSCFISIYNKFEDEPVVGLFMMKEPFLLVRDPKLVNDVLVRNFTSFYNRGVSAYRHKGINPLSENLFALNDDKWHKLRVKLSPAFTQSKLKMLYGQMEECTNLLLEVMENEQKESENLEISKLCAKLTVDVIGTCAFGLDCQSLKGADSDFYKNGLELFQPRISDLFRIVIMAIHPKLSCIIRIPEIPKKLSNFYLSIVKNNFKYRNVNNVRRNDIFQLLVDLKNSQYNPNDYTFFGEPKSPSIEDNFDELDVAANAFLFMAAGFETTASTLSFCLYELAVNSDIQNKLREKINFVKDKYGGKITVEALKDLIYLEMTIAETLRKYPSLPILFRICTQPYTIPNSNTTIKVGDKLVIPVLPIQNDPKYYPEPEKFDPERFSNQNKELRSPGTYLPFGDGPRICIGIKFAQMELKLALSRLLLKYEFSKCSKTRIPLEMTKGQFTLRPVGGIWLKAERIDQ